MNMCNAHTNTWDIIHMSTSACIFLLSSNLNPPSSDVIISSFPFFPSPKQPSLVPLVPYYVLPLQPSSLPLVTFCSSNCAFFCSSCNLNPSPCLPPSVTFCPSTFTVISSSGTLPLPPVSLLL